MNRVDIYLCGFSAHPFEGPVDGLQRVFGLPRPKAEGLLASLPQYVLVDLDRDEATPWTDALKAFGAQVEVHPHEEEHIAEVTVARDSPAALGPNPQLANPTISLSAPPASSAPTPGVAAAPSEPQSQRSSERFVGSLGTPRVPETAPAPTAGASSVPPPTRPEPRVSPSGRIVGSVRPPTRISAPPSKPQEPAGDSGGPIRPSTVPPVFEDALRGEPSKPPPSKTPPGQLWAPTPAYRSNPPSEPFTIRIPVRIILLVGGFAALIWTLYSLASP